MTTAAADPLPTLRLGNRRVPVVFPTLRDPRLHLAGVIISIHVLGQLGLGFEVSVAQILVAIGTCAVMEIAWTLRRVGQLVWPASAMLTGSGVALIFRVLGTEHGDWWSMRGWHLFALVAALSLLTKYYVRWGGSHVFNPSNVGLVVAFLALGSSRAEPLDFWWAPLGGWMILAYAIILAGGLAITARLGLLGMAVSFYLTLAAAIGVLSASGHSITARWSFEPVSGAHFWWIIVTSPEVLIFLFFMITDPKTVPSGRVGRIAFGAVVAIVCTLLIAPQTTEFGAKVALLGGLVLVSAARPVFDHLAPAAGSAHDRIGRALTRLFAGAPGAHRGLRPVLARGVLAASAVALLAAGVAAAGAPAREPAREVATGASPDAGPIATEVDPAAIPPVTVSEEAAGLSSDPSGLGEDLAVSLLQNLQVEAAALQAGDATLLAAADHGVRLEEMQLALEEAAASGRTTVAHYQFDSLHLTVEFPYGEQGGASPGLEARGSMEEITYDAGGAEVERVTSPCAITFTLVEASDGSWLIVDATPIET